jgi:hypothetical protein
MTPPPLRVACFVSSHGFGHASRIAAIITQIYRKDNRAEIMIFSQVPSWFWPANLPRNCRIKVINEKTDVGLVQKDPFHHSLEDSYVQVEEFLSFSDSRIKRSTTLLRSLDPHLILSDISPLGIELGNRLQIPAILLENFTWDWLYKSYIEQYPRFEHLVEILKRIYNKADLRIQCRPFCEKIKNSTPVNPIFRFPQSDRNAVLSRLGLSSSDKYVILTTGGIPMKHKILENTHGFHVIIPGNYNSINRLDKVTYIPMNFDIAFIDLVRSSSHVIGKGGYSTVSECWGMNIPFTGVFREHFPESQVLKEFCQKALTFNEISHPAFIDGSWVELLKDLPVATMKHYPRINGATQAVEEIVNFINE